LFEARVQLVHHAVKGHDQVPRVHPQRRVVFHDVKVVLLVLRNVVLDGAQHFDGLGDGGDHGVPFARVVAVVLKILDGFISPA
jgi:hypothetical protein